MFAAKSSQVIAKDPITSEFDEKCERLMARVARLAGRQGRIVQESGFILADQVLTHALVASGIRFDITDRSRRAKSGIRDITLDRYGLVLSGKATDSATSADTFLKGWSNADLVQYVLDHEIPVDPEDMPGAVQRAA